MMAHVCWLAISATWSQTYRIEQPVPIAIARMTARYGNETCGNIIWWVAPIGGTP